MIDHLVGRPNPSWKRTQVFLVIFFWVWKIVRGGTNPPRILYLKRANRYLRRFTPWQIIVSTLTAVYTLRNLDKVLGLSSPEPLARLYSPSYYRATWISTGLDAGFATAMSVRPKWLRDICSILFSIYYIIYANEADEKLRRYRAVPTVEMFRTTWEKTTNPYLRAFAHLPKIAIKRKILLPRPVNSKYTRPITAYLFFSGDKGRMSRATDLILDFPGGGFVAMSPEHHEERLRMWAVATGRPVLSVDYGKAPEYPYPFAIDEAFDAYRVLVESGASGFRGSLVGMSGTRLNAIMTGDSAGAALVVNTVFKVLEQSDRSRLPLPVALVLNYAALDFNFTSWMSADNLQVLRSEQSSGNLPGLKELAAQKDHLEHVSPLSMVEDSRAGSLRRHSLKRKSSWKDTIRNLRTHEPASLKRSSRSSSAIRELRTLSESSPSESGEENDNGYQREEDRPILDRVRYAYGTSDRPPSRSWQQRQDEMLTIVEEADSKAMEAITVKRGTRGSKRRAPIGTRLTMTSRTGYFQDRIVSPSMMRAMAILYIGPHRNPDFATDHYLSPILAPAKLLAQFPPVLMQCGEKDPFVDDTVIFAGRIREAKRARRVELGLAYPDKSDENTESRTSSATDIAASKERTKLESETEDDWVQMVLFSDWSHGYLQMPAIMSEAKAVIEDQAEWINATFAKHTTQTNGEASELPTATGKDQLAWALDKIASSISEESKNDESGIIFIPKKQQNDSSLAAGGSSDRVCQEDKAKGRTEACATPLSSVSCDTPKAGSSRQAGTPITETELMRRRRLLDVHIYE